MSTNKTIITGLMNDPELYVQINAALANGVKQGFIVTMLPNNIHISIVALTPEYVGDRGDIVMIRDALNSVLAELDKRAK